jgi:hypothetical protein
VFSFPKPIFIISKEIMSFLNYHDTSSLNQEASNSNSTTFYKNYFIKKIRTAWEL